MFFYNYSTLSSDSWIHQIPKCHCYLYFNITGGLLKFLSYNDVFQLYVLQMLEDMKNMLQAAEEKKQASLADLSAKHQKVRHICRMNFMLSIPPIIFQLSSVFFVFIQSLESLQIQLSDALSDRNKATETISSLQVKVNSKCSLSLMHCTIFKWKISINL